MITFKQFFNEEDETDQLHDSVEAAAREYLQHCKQFPDVNKPLYRLSGESWQAKVNHPLRTRVPRTRKSHSLGGSGAQQRWLFSQPEWRDFPPRRQSIFCSTTMEFEVGEPDDDFANVLMIYPFDGVKIAVLNDTDLNVMNIMKATSMNRSYQSLSDVFELIEDVLNFFRGTMIYDTLRGVDEGDAADTINAQLKIIKSIFNKNGKFDSEADGDDELADKYAEVARENPHLGRLIKVVATEIPEKFSPEALGVKLVTSSGLDLPGDTRECWFSGKYLSVPYRYHKEFVEAVKSLK